MTEAHKKRILSDTAPEKAFWTTNGVICRNIYELANNVAGLSEKDFKYHVNEDNRKNDFAKWIREVLEDEDLAARLRSVMDKARYSDIIRQRIRELDEEIHS